eukprot:TRINITY_DN413_c0_g1_i1.p1 TRINITY_DN413_c0_g1~~TRINITY_DN413_c0_g1_i1.p1  ORF type:complete len:636 (-),score=145.35 TRINITY_DN413_c0_g1_i1:1091-2998(-)
MTKYYKLVVHQLEKFIAKAHVRHKISGLYILDSIIKVEINKYANSAKYPARFEKNIRNTVKAILSTNQDDWDKAIRVFNIWAKEKLFSERSIELIDSIVHNITGKNLDRGTGNHPPKTLVQNSISNSINNPPMNNPHMNNEPPMNNPPMNNPHINNSPAMNNQPTINNPGINHQNLAQLLSKVLQPENSFEQPPTEENLSSPPPPDDKISAAMAAAAAWKPDTNYPVFNYGDEDDQLTSRQILETKRQVERERIELEKKLHHTVSAEKLFYNSQPEPIVEETPTKMENPEDLVVVYSKTLFVGNLSPYVTEDKLRHIFSEFGQIKSLKLVDKGTNRFAFVGYISRNDAEIAKRSMDGKEIDGTHIKLGWAKGFEDTLQDFDISTGTYNVKRWELNNKKSNFNRRDDRNDRRSFDNNNFPHQNSGPPNDNFNPNQRYGNQNNFNQFSNHGNYNNPPGHKNYNNNDHRSETQHSSPNHGYDGRYTHHHHGGRDNNGNGQYDRRNDNRSNYHDRPNNRHNNNQWSDHGGRDNSGNGQYDRRNDNRSNYHDRPNNRHNNNQWSDHGGRDNSGNGQYDRRNDRNDNFRPRGRDDRGRNENYDPMAGSDYDPMAGSDDHRGKRRHDQDDNNPRKRYKSDGY